MPFTGTGNTGRRAKELGMSVCLGNTEFETSVVHVGEAELALDMRGPVFRERHATVRITAESDWHYPGS